MAMFPAPVSEDPEAEPEAVAEVGFV